MKKILVALLIFMASAHIALAQTVWIDASPGSNIWSGLEGPNADGTVGEEYIYQEVTIPNNGDLASFDFYLMKLGDPSNSLTVKVFQGGSYPDVSQGSTLIATSEPVLENTLDNSCAAVSFTFPDLPALSGGSQYFFRIERSARDTSNYVGVCGNNTDFYNGGIVGRFRNGWLASSAVDYDFTAYKEPPKFLKVANASDFAGNVAGGVANNMTPVAGVLGLVGAIPVLFFVARRITGLF